MTRAFIIDQVQCDYVEVDAVVNIPAIIIYMMLSSSISFKFPINLLLISLTSG